MSVAPTSSQTSNKIIPRLLWVAGILALGWLLAWMVSVCAPFVIDDAFISFRYAENFAHGAGLVYNPGEHVEGYTNFLWVLLIAAVNWLGGNSLFWSKVLGTAANAITIALVILAAHKQQPPLQWSWLALLPGFMLASNFGFVLWGVGGLETALYVCLVTAALIQLAREATGSNESYATPVAPPDATRWQRIVGQSATLPLSAILFGLGEFARPDATVLFAGGMIGWAAWAAINRRLNQRLIMRLALTAMLYGAIVAAHTLFRFVYYGDWVPNTVYSKLPLDDSFFQIHWDKLLDWLHPWALVDAYSLNLSAAPGFFPPWWRELLALLTNPVLWLLLLGLFAARRHVWGWISGATIVVWLIYMGRVNGDWMPAWRYYLPITPVVTVLVLAGLNYLVSKAALVKWGGVRRLALLALVLIAPALVWLSLRDIQTQYILQVVGHSSIQAVYRTAGDLLHDHAQPGATLAAIDTGSIPYFSSLYTIDVGGLADKHMARVPYLPWTVDKGDGVVRNYPALRADPTYILQLNPDFVQLSGLISPAGHYTAHYPETAVLYQAMLKEGVYDLDHPVFYDPQTQLILVKRKDTYWKP